MDNILTESEVLNFLKAYLEKKKHACICKYGNQHGYDLEARKGNSRILIEAKGAKANKHQGNKIQSYFRKIN